MTRPPYLDGCYLVRERVPEGAPFPFLALLDEHVGTGRSQALIATHSPLLMTFPGARILSFDGGPPRPVAVEETSHWRLTRAVLADPERFWRSLREGDPPDAK